MESNPQVSKPNFRPLLLKCIDCNSDFLLPADEQLFFYRKNLAMPKRCPECRQHRRNSEVVK